MTYLQVFSEEISDAEAQEIGQRILRVFSLLLRPLPDNSDGKSDIPKSLI